MSILLVAAAMRRSSVSCNATFQRPVPCNPSPDAPIEGKRHRSDPPPSSVMDDRRDVALANNSKDIGYFHKSFALNYLYAQRHAMEFVIVRPTRAATDSWLGGDSGLCPAWCRVKILASLVASHRQRHSCHWVLYVRVPPPSPGLICQPQMTSSDKSILPCFALLLSLCSSQRSAHQASDAPASTSAAPAGADPAACPPPSVPLALRPSSQIDSDAYVREQHVDFLERLDTPRNADVQIAISREELPAGGFRSPRKRAHGVRVPSLNAGVLFVKASALLLEMGGDCLRLRLSASSRRVPSCDCGCARRGDLPLIMRPLDRLTTCMRLSTAYRLHAPLRRRPNGLPSSSRRGCARPRCRCARPFASSGRASSNAFMSCCATARCCRVAGAPPSRRRPCRCAISHDLHDLP